MHNSELFCILKSVCCSESRYCMLRESIEEKVDEKIRAAECVSSSGIA